RSIFGQSSLWRCLRNDAAVAIADRPAGMDKTVVSIPGCARRDMCNWLRPTVASRAYAYAVRRPAPDCDRCSDTNRKSRVDSPAGSDSETDCRTMPDLSRSDFSKMIVPRLLPSFANVPESNWDSPGRKGSY